MKKFFSFLLMCLAILNFTAQAEATVVKGYAAIVNGDVNRAREDAKRQAMRELVDQVVGVKIQGSTEVVNSMLVSDKILSNSIGYATINKIIKEETRGDILYIEMDVTASADRIRSTAQDLKSRLDANVNQSEMRGGIITSIVQKENGVYSYATEFGNYINGRLIEVGLKAVANDEVSKYLLTHSNDPDVGLKARALARDSEDREATQANAFLRGTLSLESVRSVPGGLHEALVKASFELVGFSTNDIDVFDKYFKAVSPVRDDAIEQAKENATREAMDSLARQALETVQTETQKGGGGFVETTLVFDDLTDMSAQLPLIKAALSKLNCEIIRSRFPNASKAIYLVSVSSLRKDTLMDDLMEELPGFTPPKEGIGLGASKIKLLFNGGA